MAAAKSVGEKRRAVPTNIAQRGLHVLFFLAGRVTADVLRSVLLREALVRWLMAIVLRSCGAAIGVLCCEALICVCV